MASVTLKNVKKVYPQTKTPAVDNFNLNIKDKEFVVLVGPSGCGKTTTLRMIAGLENLSEGEILIGKQKVNEVEPKDRDVAMVFQNYALYPHMNVYDNIAFALKKRIKSKSEIDKKVREAAKILDLTDYLKRKPKDLSGGQRQRVAIGRAIVRNPKVMLMDEPLSNLDTILRAQMRTEIIALRKKIKTTFVYVTHDQTEAMTLGDRIVVMKEGKIQQVGTPQEVFSNPSNTFVASFIGTPQMNFFDAKLVKSESGYKVVMGNFHTTVSKDQEKALKKNGVESCDVILGVRPESLQMTNNKISFGANIDMVEMMGSSVILHLSHNKQKALLVTQALDKNGKLKMDYQNGSVINFRFVPEAMHLFDSKTGNSLLK